MNFKNILIAVFLYAFLSLSSVFMKFASLQNELLYKVLLYGLAMMFLGIFAILWQKMLKKFDLSKVYIFKSTTIIWGMIFGLIFFSEKISVQMIIGALITIFGVCIMIMEGQHE